MDSVFPDSFGRKASRADLRRRAFEANLSVNLKEAIGDEIHPVNLSQLVRVLGEAHKRVHHFVDARTSVGFGSQRAYIVLQMGLAPSAKSLRSCGPLAASVLKRVPDGTLDDFSSRERSKIADCVDRAEITRVHAVDWRPRATIRIAQFYINLLAGRDQRQHGAVVDHDRRAPVNEGIGAAILMTIFMVTAGFGLWFLGTVISQGWDLMRDEEARSLIFGR